VMRVIVIPRVYLRPSDRLTLGSQSCFKRIAGLNFRSYRTPLFSTYDIDGREYLRVLEAAVSSNLRIALYESLLDVDQMY
jgi:hypothetical protein